MNVYEIVTEKIIAQLQAGEIPWRKPWRDVGPARSLASKKFYRGINHFLLDATKYASPYWLTYRQAGEFGGNVRAGEKSTLIVFWKTNPKASAAKDDAGEPADTWRYMLRYYRVFNLEQCENLPEKVLAKLPKPRTAPSDPIEAAERIIAGYPNPPTFDRGKFAGYAPELDRIMLPARELLLSPEEYYSTAFHEIGHSTGHKSRLSRPAIGNPEATFGTALYAREELVAEMTSAFLCGRAGISPAVIENQAAYIQGWLKNLRGDSRLVVMAAAQAQRAADFVLGMNQTQTTETTDSEAA